MPGGALQVDCGHKGFKPDTFPLGGMKRKRIWGGERERGRERNREIVRKRGRSEEREREKT